MTTTKRLAATIVAPIGSRIYRIPDVTTGCDMLTITGPNGTVTVTSQADQIDRWVEQIEAVEDAL